MGENKLQREVVLQHSDPCSVRHLPDNPKSLNHSTESHPRQRFRRSHYGQGVASDVFRIFNSQEVYSHCNQRWLDDTAEAI